MKVGKVEFGPSDKADDYKKLGIEEYDIGLPLEEWSVERAKQILKRHGQSQSSWIKICDGCELPEDGQLIWIWSDGHRGFINYHDEFPSAATDWAPVIIPAPPTEE